jgi:hypothetical protein
VLGTLEVFTPNALVETRGLEVTSANLAMLVSSLAQHAGSSLRLIGLGQQLWISASHGKYAVLLTGGEDSFFDLLAVTRDVGNQPFAHGGSIADHPRRHIVDVAAAIRVAEEFVRMSHIAPDAESWERQGSRE